MDGGLGVREREKPKITSEPELAATWLRDPVATYSSTAGWWGPWQNGACLSLLTAPVDTPVVPYTRTGISGKSKVS